MIRARANGWILETACERAIGKPGTVWRAWVSNRKRQIIGFAGSGANATSEADAVRRALIDAASHWAKDCDAITELEREYFGPTGMLATGANAASGQ